MKTDTEHVEYVKRNPRVILVKRTNVNLVKHKIKELGKE